MFDRIVVPLDGSSFGEAALPFAIALARRSGAVLNLVHVHSLEAPGERLEALPQFRFQQVDRFDDAFDAAALERARSRLEQIAERILEESDVRSVVRVLRGPVALRLEQFLAAAPAGLVVMSTRGEPGRWPWTERVHEAVIARGRAPVLLIPAQRQLRSFEARGVIRLLVPLDGSLLSEQIVRPAGALAATLGAEITLLKVLKPPRFPETLTPASGLHEPNLELSRGYLEHVARALPALRASPRTKVVSHPQPTAAILATLEEGGYDGVALATHGHGGAHHLLVGSTADEVVRAAGVPVLVFRPTPLELEAEPTAEATPLLNPLAY